MSKVSQCAAAALFMVIRSRAEPNLELAAAERSRCRRVIHCNSMDREVLAAGANLGRCRRVTHSNSIVLTLC